MVGNSEPLYHELTVYPNKVYSSQLTNEGINAIDLYPLTNAIPANLAV